MQGELTALSVSLELLHQLHAYSMALVPVVVLIYSHPLSYRTTPLSAVPQDSPQQLAPTGKLH